MNLWFVVPAAALFVSAAWTESAVRRFIPLADRGRKRRRSLRINSLEYYRLYKYLYLQAGVQARAEDTLRRLHRVTDHPSLKQALYEMSLVLTHSNDIRQAIDCLRRVLAGSDGETFITILETIRSGGLRREVFERFDRMLFQKYLIDLSARTKRMKREYFIAVLLFCLAVFGVLFLPMVQQMIDSLQIIFR